MAKVKSPITAKGDNTLWNDLFFTGDSLESYFYTLIRLKATKNSKLTLNFSNNHYLILGKP